jgi:FkbH-like protein
MRYIQNYPKYSIASAKVTQLRHTPNPSAKIQSGQLTARTLSAGSIVAASSSNLDYFALVREAGAVGRERFQKIRLAILADFATQQLVTLLTALAAREKIDLEIYEAGYDSIQFEILNQDSSLYEFKPQVIAILVASQKLKARLTGIENRGMIANDSVEATANLWRVLRERSSATIIQGNYAVPLERAFGHYELKAPEAIGSLFCAINHGIALRARETDGVLLFDMNHIAATVGLRAFFDERLWTLAKTPCRLELLPIVAKELLDIAKARSGTIVKCVVLDLDNTLWGGVIGDDGLEGILLGDFDEGEAFVVFQSFLKELKRRGIILAVVSKNDPENALLPFKEHPRMVLKEDDISVFIANWQPKSDNIGIIQKTLNIGLDSMVFLDDNPMERDLVRKFLPDLIVPELPEDPALYVPALAALNLFETASFSEADKARAGQYREEAQRRTAEAQFSDINDYLRSLEMSIVLERFNEFNLPRIAQLSQRSNQFNLTTQRHDEAECRAMMNNDAVYVPFTVTLSDKFGDYGLISVVILRLGERDVLIDQYLMSCRVLKRGVESFAMNSIFEVARRFGKEKVVGRYIPSGKNNMVAGFYAGFGFRKTATSDAGDQTWSLSVDEYKPQPIYFAARHNALEGIS